MSKIRFKKRSGTTCEIPTSTMGDISFLLIIFFMVTTVFVVYRGIPVELPKAEKIDTVKSRRNIVNVWVAGDGRIMVDEFNADLSNVGSLVRQKLDENPRVVVLLKSDRATLYRQISGVIEELKKYNALRVSFIAKREQ